MCWPSPAIKPGLAAAGWVLLLGSISPAQAQAPTQAQVQVQVQAQTPASTPAQAQGPSALFWDDTRREQLLPPARDFLSRVFSLAQKFETDADLRQSVQALVDVELPRMHRLLATWLDQELQLDPAAPFNAIAWRLSLRVANEITLWRLDVADAGHAQLLQQAYLHPSACHPPKGTESLLDLLVHRWRAVPLDKRAELLAAEATVLRRWGLPRETAPARPVPSVEDLAVRAIDDLLLRQVPPPVPMSPALAWGLLNERATDAHRKYPQTRCLMQQWGHALALKQDAGAAAEAAALSLRYGLAPTAEVWWGKDHADEPGGDDYPKLARVLEVQGVVGVVFSVNGQGQLQHAFVDQRNMQVSGVAGTQGQRPVAMETLLDAASLVRVSGMTHTKPQPEQLKDGRVTRRVQFEWKLE